MQIRCDGLAFGVRGIGDTMAGWLGGWGLWRWNGVLGLGYEAYDTLFEEPFPHITVLHWKGRRGKQQYMRMQASDHGWIASL
jgi:hypothetical protein